jgi:hypothetical protein
MGPTNTAGHCSGVKPLAVTVKCGQELIGIKTTKMWELIKDGTLETIHIGKRCLVLYASIERMVNELKERKQERNYRPDRAIKSSLAARRARKLASTQTHKHLPPDRWTSTQEYSRETRTPQGSRSRRR